MKGSLMKRLLKSLVLSAVLTVLLAPAALADVVTIWPYRDENNNINKNNVIRVKEGDTAPRWRAYVIYYEDDDGEWGCNFSPFFWWEKLEVGVAKRAGDADRATISPTNLTFTQCLQKDGSGYRGYQQIKITPNNVVGTTRYDLSEVSNTTGGGSFRYDVDDDWYSSYLWVEIENVPPQANDDYVSVDEDSKIDNIPLYANDSDPGGSYELKSYTDPPHGTVRPWSYTGVDLEYTPDPGFSGTDYFTYTIDDFNGGTDTAMVTVTVNPVNDAPTATDDSYAVAEDGTLTEAAPGVLANDSDVEKDSLAATKVGDPAHGSLTLNSDGSFTYKPEANFNGTDSFTYKVSDGTADSGTATVEITVDPLSDPACSDGSDNDKDGKTDHPSDPGCSSASDNDETDPPPPPSTTPPPATMPPPSTTPPPPSAISPSSPDKCKGKKGKAKKKCKKKNR